MDLVTPGCQDRDDRFRQITTPNISAVDHLQEARSLVHPALRPSAGGYDRFERCGRQEVTRAGTNDDKSEVLQGTLDLLVLKTLETMGPMHGWGIARRLEQAGWIRSDWGVSETNRRARFYALAAAGRRRLREEERNWDRMSAVIARVLRSEA